MQLSAKSMGFSLHALLPCRILLHVGICWSGVDHMCRFNWKLDQMGIDEKLGWDLWEHSSYMYFRVSVLST